MNPFTLIQTASFSPISLQAPDAWIGHTPFAAWLIKETAPECFVELGTHSGNSYFSFCQAVLESDTPTKCYAVDTWQGDEQAGFYDDEVYSQVFEHNQARYARFSRLLRMTFDEARTYFADHSIDLLHIDGLHSYEAVKHDFETWRPKLRPGALVLFHDTNVRDKGFGVWRYWEELQAVYPDHLEFYHSHGLGVLQVHRVPDGKKPPWLEKRSTQKQCLRNYFASVGARQTDRFGLRSANCQIVELNQAVAQHVGRIDALTTEMSERESRMAGLNKALADSNARIDALENAAAERDRQISFLSRTVAERDVHITNLDSIVAAIIKSRSWRYTAPLRVVIEQVRRARSLRHLMFQTVHRHGGFYRTMRAASAILHREGFRGYKHRLLSGCSKADMAVIALDDGRCVDANDYSEWMHRYDTLDSAGRQKTRQQIACFKYRPKISVIMPVYNPPLEFLDEAIRSVRGQLYPDWELCMADDASRNEKITDLLKRHAQEDPRIKVVFREENGHISAASNSALHVATGEFVALLDHDDLLPEHALYWVARVLNDHPGAALIYSDEDKINEAGQRYDPYFKCGFNYELLLAQNMISHLGVYRRDVLRKIGGFRPGFEGSQDYDLALRAIEQIQTDQIIHIPRVLYHWRAIKGSTALSSDAKDYAANAGRRAVAEHLERTGRKAELMVAPQAEAFNRVRFQLPGELPWVSIIIPTRDRADLLSVCIDSILRKTSYLNYEVLIIDNGSCETATLKLFDSLPEERVRIIHDPSDFNYSALNNHGVREAKGQVLCLMNNDIEILTPDWIEEMLSFALQADTGCVGARLWYPDGKLQHAGVVLGIAGIANHAHKQLPKGAPGYFGRAVLHQSFSAVTAACLMIRREVFEAVNGLDEELAVAFNDIDFCLRVRTAGFRNIWTPFAEMIHHESASRGADTSPAKRERFSQEIDFMKGRWGNALYCDPAYSPNLTLENENFSLAWPPRLEPIWPSP